MFIDKNQRRWALKALFLAVLLAALAVTAGAGLAQGLVEYALILLAEVPAQTVDVRSENGDPVAVGTIRGNVTTGENGAAAGEFVLETADQTGAGVTIVSLVEIDPDASTFDAQGRVVLSGQGRLEKDGKVQFFPAAVTMAPETAVPAGCIWSGDVKVGIRDTGSRPVLPGGFYADVSGATILAWTIYPGAWPSSMTGPHPACDS